MSACNGCEDMSDWVDAGRILRETAPEVYRAIRDDVFTAASHALGDQKAIAPPVPKVKRIHF